MHKCFDVQYKTNDIGAKDYNFSKLKNKKKRAILLGDSFAEGFGVDNANTFKSYLENLTDLEIYNFGSSGALGPLQYYLIYENLAKQYEHDSVIISFLPANDFNENDYNLWKQKKWNLIDGNVERYRPYYIKKNNNKFDFFIPENAQKRDNWYYLDQRNLKQNFEQFIKDNLWSFNIYKSYTHIRYYSNKSDKIYSGFFDAGLEQQEAAVFFLKKILNSKNFDFAAIIIFPSREDIDRIKVEKKSLDKQKWFKELKNLENELDFDFKLINIVDYLESSEEYEKYQHSCDRHLNKDGNKFVAKILNEIIVKKD